MKTFYQFYRTRCFQEATRRIGGQGAMSPQDAQAILADPARLQQLAQQMAAADPKGQWSIDQVKEYLTRGYEPYPETEPIVQQTQTSLAPKVATQDLSRTPAAIAGRTGGAAALGAGKPNVY